MTTIDAYIARQPEPQRSLLSQMRAIVRRVLPSSTEAIAYGMPAVQIDGTSAFFYSGWKKHLAIYPVDAALLGRFADGAALSVDAAATLKLPLDRALPVALIEGLALARAEDARLRAAVKAAKKLPKHKLPKKKPAKKKLPQKQAKAKAKAKAKKAKVKAKKAKVKAKAKVK